MHFLWFSWKQPQIVNHGDISHNCGKYRVNIIMDDKTMLYFEVPIAYQIQQILFKKYGGGGCVAILVSIFKYGSNTHWRKILRKFSVAHGSKWSQIFV